MIKTIDSDKITEGLLDFADIPIKDFEKFKIGSIDVIYPYLKWLKLVKNHNTALKED